MPRAKPSGAREESEAMGVQPELCDVCGAEVVFKPGSTLSDCRHRIILESGERRKSWQPTPPRKSLNEDCPWCPAKAGETCLRYEYDHPGHPKEKGTDPGPSLLPEEAKLAEPTKRKKAVYVGAPACFALEQACQHINAALGGYGCYVVGSALERPDWRDVDVRYILSDEEFDNLFPNAAERCWEQDPRWLLLTVSISAWLSKQTGLPIDFQIQPQTHANERHKGPRNAVGIRIAKAARSEQVGTK